MAQSLVPVALHGATLHAVVLNGVPHVTLRSLCDALGLELSAQWRRIQRHPVLSQGVAMTAMPSAGGDQQAMCLPISLLNGWLFGIHASRVRPELRDRLVQYQRECFDVLAQHFGDGAAGRARQPGLDASRYIAEVSVDGSLKLRPWPDGAVAGTPEALASAVASGGWGMDATARMLAACTQAMQQHHQAMTRRAGNLQAAVDELRREAQQRALAKQARQQRLANRAAVQAPAQPPAQDDPH